MKAILMTMAMILMLASPVMALNLTYDECADINGTVLCAPSQNICTQLSYGNCSALYTDNCTNTSNAVYSLLDQRTTNIINTFSNSFGNVTSKFVSDCIDWKSQLKDANTNIENMRLNMSLMNSTSEQLTNCNSQLDLYRGSSNQYNNQSQFWFGEYNKIKDSPQLFGIGGLCLGAIGVYYFMSRKRRTNIHGKEGYAQYEGGRKPVDEGQLKKAEDMP